MRILLVALLICPFFLSGNALALSPPLFTNDRTAFEASFSALSSEDFEEGNVAPAGARSCSPLIRDTTDDGCFDSGDIVSGIEFSAPPTLPDMAIIGAGRPSVPANASIALKGSASDSVNIVFPHGVESDDVYAVGLDLMSEFTGDTCDVEVFGARNELIGSTSVECSDNFTNFFGVASNEPVRRISITSELSGAEVVDNVIFGPWNADVSVAVSTPTNTDVIPGDTIVYTLVITNNGPDTAAGIRITNTLPRKVVHVSNDCGAGEPADNVLSFIPDFGALGVGASFSCIVTTTVDDGARGSIVNSVVASVGSPDPDASNNSAAVEVSAPNLDVVLGNAFRKRRSRLTVKMIATDRASEEPYNLAERIPGVACRYQVTVARGNAAKIASASFESVVELPTVTGEESFTLKKMPGLRSTKRDTGQPRASLQAKLICDGLGEFSSNVNVLKRLKTARRKKPYRQWLGALRERFDKLLAESTS